jgi:hypothetical protein
MNRQKLWLAILLGVSAGCGPTATTAIERTASLLRSGITRSNVDLLFSKFDAGKEVEFDHRVEDYAVVREAPVLFQTNVARGMKVTYWPKEFGVFAVMEKCDVYFDTNGVIVGYWYSREH